MEGLAQVSGVPRIRPTLAAAAFTATLAEVTVDLSRSGRT